MSHLKVKIHDLESVIADKKIFLNQQWETLQTRMKSPGFLMTSLITGVTLGYLISNHRFSKIRSMIKESIAKFSPVFQTILFFL